jgi:hypothetical protein
MYIPEPFDTYSPKGRRQENEKMGKTSSGNNYCSSNRPISLIVDVDNELFDSSQQSNYTTVFIRVCSSRCVSSKAT